MARAIHSDLEQKPSVNRCFGISESKISGTGGYR
jgi:hypothetical protein